jgi:hypothetical protein
VPRAMRVRRAKAPMMDPMKIGVVLVVLEFAKEAALPPTVACGAAESVSEPEGSGRPPARVINSSTLKVGVYGRVHQGAKFCLGIFRGKAGISELEKGEVGFSRYKVGKYARNVRIGCAS